MSLTRQEDQPNWIQMKEDRGILIYKQGKQQA